MQTRVRREKNHLTLQARVRKQRPGITLTAEATTTLAGLSTPVAGDTLQAGAPVSEGEFEILTYYYRIAIRDTATGRSFLRLRAVLQ